MRRLIASSALIPLLLAGCGGAETASPLGAGPSALSSAAGTAGDAITPGSSSAPGAAAACPTDNTRAFAKTRFVADLGGSAFLIRRYIYQPYQAGTLTKGADGRTVALVKAAAAAGASVKLLNNATENAKADPTLCKTLAAPLTQLTGQLNGLTSGLTSGNFNPSVVGGLGGAVTGLLGQAGKAGVPVTEQPRGLG